MFSSIFLSWKCHLHDRKYFCSIQNVTNVFFSCSDTQPLIYHGAREEGLIEDEWEHHHQVPKSEALHGGAQPAVRQGRARRAVRELCQPSRLDHATTHKFDAEVGTPSSIWHVNVVKLLCSVTSEDGEASLLVYEHLPNNDIYERLHGPAVWNLGGLGRLE